MAEQDFVKVYKWGSIALQSGLDDAKELFVYLINFMPPEQVDVAKILAMDWTAENSLRNQGDEKTRDDQCSVKCRKLVNGTSVLQSLQN